MTAVGTTTPCATTASTFAATSATTTAGYRRPPRAPSGRTNPLSGDRSGPSLTGLPTGTAARSGPTRPGRAGPVYRGLPKPLRIGLWVALAVAVGVVVGATAPVALRRIGAVAGLKPGILPWYSVRASGILAYLALATSVAYGLMLSTRLLDVVAHRPVTVTLHKELAVASVGLSLVHGALLLLDRTFAFTPLGVLLPFASPYAPIAVGAGQLAFYLIAVVTASFYLRRRIGQRAWRRLHYLTFAAFLGATGHGIAAGSDSGTAWGLWLYLLPGAAVAFLLTYRIVTGLGARLGRNAITPATQSAGGDHPAAVPRRPPTLAPE